MDQQCIFCGIISGKVPSKTIYEDDVVKVILDIYPANPAHLLLLTKKHYAIFNQLSKEEAEQIGKISRLLTELIFKVLKPDGINLFIANGAVAGQKAPHFMMHIIPRFQNDGINFEFPEKSVDENDISEFYSRIKTTLKNYFPAVDFDGDRNENFKGKNNPKKDIDLDKISEMFL
ncbi:MAG: HIT family protein [Candidatus Woesearchaeota archaeon]